jgi:tRNA-2-methylthio-N6-dimethylallyladenosine synthase
VRGREKSRKPNEIIDEIKFLIDKGVKEITLLGQNVNSYGKNLDEIDNFPKLLHMVNDIDGLERIRFVTSHPKDFSGELIDAVSELDKVCEYLHLPLQAGSDSVLKSMNRKYTYGEYRDKILKAKDKISNLSLSSDFIVGFPGETDKDFEQTLTALKEIEYETLFAFKYSVRPGTKAENLDDDVPEKVKSERLTELLKLQYEISEKIQEKYIDTSLEVLVEGMSKKDNKVYMGRSRQNRIVNFESDISLNKGDIVNVNITEAKKNTLYGILEKV